VKLGHCIPGRVVQRARGLARHCVVAALRLFLLLLVPACASLARAVAAGVSLLLGWWSSMLRGRRSSMLMERASDTYAPQRRNAGEHAISGEAGAVWWGSRGAQWQWGAP
jgi:hypothetical protein